MFSYSRRMKVAGWCAALLFCAIVDRAAAAPADASSIQEFMEAKNNWPQLVGRPLNLEGRYTVLSNSDMQFAGCSVRFLLPKTFLRPRSDSKNLEVSGHLEKQNGVFVFVVSSVKSRPSDLETLELKRVIIDSRRPDALYELGLWARNRGAFYKDDDLVRSGTELLETGLSRAFELLSADDVDGMRSLAARVVEYGLPDRLRIQYLHEANRSAFDKERMNDKPEYQSLLSRITGDLPGSSTLLPPERDLLRRDYLKEPRLAYRLADAGTRRLFDRIFYGEVVLAEIEREAAADGSNGEAIAEKITKRLPEHTELIQWYRDRELDYLTGRASALSREQVLSLADRYIARGKPERAADVKRQWLDARVRNASLDGPVALIELGEDYLNLLQDSGSAARMYQLAYEANPQLSTASTWLTEQGYELHEGRWTLPGQASQTERDRLAEAIHEGRVLVGMTGAQVRAALGGAPSSVVRMATAGQISEIWLYAELGISVQLARRSQQRQLSVRRVTDAP
ncbi:MAG: hypothetical protein KF861_01815 [Planctomycetaceae bacterium]|nr:hypothetical protein [Planctomycetaceae bacterium]